MTLSPELRALATYLAGEFDNREQALCEPVWYVHLRLWHRPLPIPLFSEPCFAFYAEQASIVNLDQPYRPRILQLRPCAAGLEVQYYKFKNIALVQGAGQNPGLLKQLRPEDIELLPGCTLTVVEQQIAPNSYHFRASLPPGGRCCFTHNEQTFQVDLGFEATSDSFLSYDKGIDPVTGKAIWGALMGPFRFTKRQDFAC